MTSFAYTWNFFVYTCDNISDPYSRIVIVPFLCFSSHAVTADVDIAEMAKAAEFFLSDGIILTGRATGLPTDTKEIHRVKNSINLPVIIGSGVTADNLEEYVTADAMIVGSHFKVDGSWFNEVDRSRVTRFMDRISRLRNQ